MSEKQVSNSLNFQLSDLYHILFRQKWTIVIIWAVGAAAAYGLWKKWPIPYQSEAKLFIRYIEDSKSIGSTLDDSIKTPDAGVLGIINSETEILTSLDVAGQVADSVTPAKILAKEDGGSDRMHAAAVVRNGLSVDAPDRSSVMLVTFKNRNPEIVQNVLSQVIDAYLKKHAEIHQTMGTMDDYVTQTTDQLKSQLNATEQELRAEKLKVGVTSLDDTKKSLAEQSAKIQEALDSAQAEFVQRQAAFEEFTNFSRARLQTNLPSQTINVVPPEKISDYKNVCTLLDSLTKMEQDQLLQFLPESPRIKDIKNRIAVQQSAKSQLEQEYPQIAGSEAVVASEEKAAPSVDIFAEMTDLKALEARISFLTNRLAEIQTGITNVNNAEAKITDLQRKRDMQEQYYRNFSDKLQRDQISDAQGADKLGNIKLVQAPSPPFRDTAKLLKLVRAVLFGSFAGGLGFAFLLEMYFDRSFKRAGEVETKLGLPLFMSIPNTNMNGNRKRGMMPKLLPGAAEQSTTSKEDNLPVLTSEIVPLKAVRYLHPFFEALRDRLITYFEVKNLTHNPKLVAITSCGRGSGVSTVASGLAASLSDTGDGNVLLVDMNFERGTAHHFHNGRLACSLDDALELEKRDEALVQENLYMVRGSSQADQLTRTLHKRFSALMPRLKASDYDYIIFDMPPVTQISPTPRLARFMDIVVLVVEAEKTDSDIAKKATALLRESKANVGIVLNKTHSYVPKFLQQQL